MRLMSQDTLSRLGIVASHIDIMCRFNVDIIIMRWQDGEISDRVFIREVVRELCSHVPT